MTGTFIRASRFRPLKTVPQGLFQVKTVRTRDEMMHCIVSAKNGTTFLVRIPKDRCTGQESCCSGTLLLSIQETPGQGYFFQIMRMESAVSLFDQHITADDFDDEKRVDDSLPSAYVLQDDSTTYAVTGQDYTFLGSGPEGLWKTWEETAEVYETVCLALMDNRGTIFRVVLLKRNVELFLYPFQGKSVGRFMNGNGATLFKLFKRE
jgi:hypothetical protein